MKFTYNDVVYEMVDPDQWTTLEAIQLQKHTGLHPVELWNDLIRAGPAGVHAAVWLTLRRASQDVAWDDLQLPHFRTVNTLDRGPVEEPPDPSPASTPQRSASPARPRPSARSKKNSGSTSP